MHISFFVCPRARTDLVGIAKLQRRRPVDLFREELLRCTGLIDKPQSLGNMLFKFRLTREQKSLIEHLANEAQVSTSEVCRRLIAAVIQRYEVLK